MGESSQGRPSRVRYLNQGSLIPVSPSGESSIVGLLATETVSSRDFFLWRSDVRHYVVLGCVAIATSDVAIATIWILSANASEI